MDAETIWAPSLQRLFQEEVHPFPEEDEPPHATLEPVYVWRDDACRLHLLTCKPQGHAVCRCRRTLKRILSREAPFVLVLVHRRRTFIMYMSRRPRLCEARCPAKRDPTSDDSEKVHMDVQLHYGDCYRRSFACECNIFKAYHRGWEAKTVEDGSVVRMDHYEGLLHRPNCNGASCCFCTKTLLERGCYKLRMELDSFHLTCDRKDLARREYPKEWLEEIPWPSLNPYDCDSVLNTLHDFVADKELDREDGHLEGYQRSESFQQWLRGPRDGYDC